MSSLRKTKYWKLFFTYVVKRLREMAPSGFKIQYFSSFWKDFLGWDWGKNKLVHFAKNAQDLNRSV